MTTITNVTPVPTVALPFTWTTAYGQAFSLSSAQSSSCVDTVTPMTANAGGTYNVKGVPLYPSQAYAVIQDVVAHYGPIVTACQSLLNQVSVAPSTSASYNGYDLMNITGNWLFDDIIVIGGAILLIVIFVVLIQWVMHLGKRTRR